MKKGLLKIIKQMPTLAGQSVKSVAKMALQSSKSEIASEAVAGEPLIVLGNGPSLSATIAEFGDTVLAKRKLMAVNFAANAPEFERLKPRYYVLADPVFFAADGNENVMKLWQNFADKVDWDMTLFVPMKYIKRIHMRNKRVKLTGFNFIGVEGFGWLTRLAYDAGRGMPRPRNVLIPAIMTGIKLGFKDIYVVGADHTWTKTLSVSDENRVVTIQPHFYKDDEKEAERVERVYRDIHMHDILLSFHIAFKAYFAIEDYARHRGINIYNATPGSFIDAFRRKSLQELQN